MISLTGKIDGDIERDSRRAFTLVEIMVSISILSLGLILILQWFSHSLNTLRISQDYLAATLFLEDRMADMEIKLKEKDSGSLWNYDKGEDNSGIKFALSAHLNPVDYKKELDSGEDAEFEDLYNLKASLSWQEGKRKGIIPLDTYLIRYDNKAE